MNNYASTSKWNTTEFNNEFYQIGSSIYSEVTNDRFLIKVSGVDENLEKTVELLELYLNDIQASEEKIAKTPGRLEG